MKRYTLLLVLSVITIQIKHNLVTNCTTAFSIWYLQVLETQNRTLAAQLRRLHQMVASGGARHGQTSTALMVLLLSTALFLIPGLNSEQESKSEIDIQVVYFLFCHMLFSLIDPIFFHIVLKAMRSKHQKM